MHMNKKPYPLVHLVNSPADPAQLPSDVFEYAYDATDQPIHMHIEHYMQLGKFVPLRYTFNLLREPPTCSHSHSAHRSQQAPSIR